MARMHASEITQQLMDTFTAGTSDRFTIESTDGPPNYESFVIVDQDKGDEFTVTVVRSPADD
jgi:hypothetical protein